jgi:hypothetical protein
MKASEVKQLLWLSTGYFVGGITNVEVVGISPKTAFAISFGMFFGSILALVTRSDKP